MAPALPRATELFMSGVEGKGDRFRAPTDSAVLDSASNEKDKLNDEVKPLENIIFSLISYSGEARSLSMEAMAKAREGAFAEAEEKLKAAETCIGNAHKFQTELIQKEAGGEKIEVSLILVHAQDHLMNAITIKELAYEIIALSRKISEK